MIPGSGSSATMPRRAPATAAAGRPGGVMAASMTQRSQAVRMNLYVLVRILFQYLERVDKSILFLAKEVLKDCERKHNTKDSKYETLADAICERVRDAVGENHWEKARKIQKQLAANQQKKKIMAMQAQKKRIQTKKKQQQESQEQQQEQVQHKIPQERVSSSSSAMAEVMDVAMTMSAMSKQASPNRTREREMGNNINSRPSNTFDIGERSTQQASKPSGQLPLRKRIMFTSTPATESKASPSKPLSGSSFTQKRR